MIKGIAKAAAAALAVAGFAGAAQATGWVGEGDGSWGGIYVGGHAGGGWADGDNNTLNATGPFSIYELDESFDMDGWLAGAHIGANVQHGAWVLGGEFSLSAADISGSKTDCGTQAFHPGGGVTVTDTYGCSKEDEWLALAMTRFGYAPGSWMGYLTLGVAVAGAQTNNTFGENVVEPGFGTQTFGPVPFTAGSSTDVGFAIGGGAEMQLGNGLIAGVEYIHVNFDDMRDGGLFTVFDYNQDLDIVRARLSMMLDRCCDGAAAAPSKTGFANILPAATNPWSGVYFGGHVGYGWSDAGATLYDAGDSHDDSIDLDGALAGVHFGASIQRGNFVFGKEISLSGAQIDGSKGEGCYNAVGVVATPQTNLGCKKEDEWLLLAMSRLGYAPSNWMIYGTYGLAVAGSQTDTTFNVPEDGFFGLNLMSGVNTNVGWALGGGGEVKLGSGIIAGIEYIHAEFDDSRSGSDGLVTEWDQDIDLVRARLSMMLNDCCAGEAAPSKTNMASVAAADGDWGGFYFGSSVGYGWASSDVSLSVPFGGQGVQNFDDGFDLDGWLLGGHFGGNVQFGTLVAGGEISISAADIDGSTSECFADFAAQVGESFGCKKQDQWLMLAMGRIGYAPGAWMAYATAGAAVVGAQTDFSHNGHHEVAGSDTDLGYAFGGGVEYKLTGNLIAGLEYIHAEFDGIQDGGDALVFDWDQDMDLVQARLSVKFGGCCEAVPAAVPLK